MKKQNLSVLIACLLFSRSGLANEVPTNSVAEQIEKGHYLAIASDCTACHTVKEGKPFAGGLAMSSPLGKIYSTNITPDKKTGIGNYSLDDFDKALRQGIAKDKRRLYPAMPYPSFVKMSDEDLRDLYAYFMYGVAPVEQMNQKEGIPWPLSIRWPLAIWDSLFVDKARYKPDPNKDDVWNRGAYLVQSLGHCGACHTPRGLAFQEKALDQSGLDYLSGGTLEGWHALNLRGDRLTGLGNWSEQNIIDFLKKGHNKKTAGFASMTDVIEDSMQYLTNTDLTAIAVYLKSLAPIDPDEPLVKEDITTQELSNGIVTTPGAQLYLDNCAACHRSDGKGYDNTFPMLDNNPVVNSADPSSVIHIILTGAKQPVTQLAPTGLTMPDFGWRLNDQEVAEIATFIRSGWRNQAEDVTPHDVAKMRELVTKEQKP